MTDAPTAAQEALRLALYHTLQDATDLSEYEHLAVLAAVLGQLLAAHVRDARDPTLPMELVTRNIELGRLSMVS